MTAYYIGIDIGGTFTDCAVLDEAGHIATIAKAPTTRDDPARAVMDSITAAAQRLGVEDRALLADTRFLLHGCTVATNAVVTRTGVKTGLITTRGHEDSIFIGKVLQKVAGLSEREMIHQARLDKADPPIVERRLVHGVSERIDRDGDVVVELNEDELDAAVAALAADGVEAVAVSLLWSFLNGAHEERVRASIAEMLPDAFVSVSHELAPVLGEYERTATTVANAYVGPKVTGYLHRLETLLHDKGYRYPLLVAHCMGGLTTMEEVGVRPLLTLDSGPVSGVLGARFFGEAYGEPNILCTDMGGTTFDVSLIERGRYVLDEAPVIDKYTYLVPKVAVESVGAGGGSIVWLDDNGLLRVGPDSAGAAPGPACYGAGGTTPTVTDVDLMLGFLNPDGFLGGAMTLDVNAAEVALAQIGQAMDTDAVGAASGAFRIVNAHMADLMRRVSIDRGRDPRDFVLFAYGGASPMHIAYLARELRIGRVYVPSFAAVFSALGMLTGGLVHNEETTFSAGFPLGADDWRELGTLYERMEARLAGLFEREGVAPSDRRFERTLYMKYRLQPTALAVPVPDPLGAPGSQDVLAEAFEARYAELYGANAGYSAAGIECLKCRVEATAATVLPRFAAGEDAPERDARDARTGERGVLFPEIGERRPTTIYDGERLGPGMRFAGPAIVERMGDTIVVPSFASARVDEFINVVLEIDGAAS